KEVPSFTVNKACGSGLKAVVLAAQAIQLGDAEVIVAGGMESMSGAPYILKKARFGIRLGHDEILDSMIADGLTCPITFVHMGINDGGAAVVVMSDRKAKELRLAPLATIRAYAAVGVDPSIMGMGPWPASEKALERAKLRREEIDLWELNEAFAAQSLGVLRELRIPKNRVNVHGGAIALGHPIGASGARVLVTLLHAMADRDARLGVASLCIGGGQGIAMVVERS